ncbi:BamA/TamA family outer membrane protein [Woeseia oceani]|uniref:Bacterial surface antigen (D15) domain-containing protein n=1 Tax=Woeseia oceani TaxID=1548547 RepID=A0A193LCY8_9GAMM|nr:outer membrane protein assembly factor [Woeseia oceani]ANO50296.1 hypothetical protein BA177_02850 [Woeseia oceani]
MHDSRIAAISQKNHRGSWLTGLLIFSMLATEVRAEAAAGLPSARELASAGAVIGDIRIVRQNVFDLSIPEENNALYRLANRLHMQTRESVIRQQLLFKPGEVYSERLVDESERLLRRNIYLYDARIRPVRYVGGVVDLEVTTRDVWTLMPGFSVSRKGGENRTRFSISENNLLGSGARVKLAYIDDVDRESTSFEYADNNLGESWTALQVFVADNSDGDSQLLRLVRPFFALDSRWSGGLEVFDSDSETRFYELGEEVAEYRESSRYLNGFGGVSSGLKNGWVRRYTAGVTIDEHRFLNTTDQMLPQLLPADRELVYPWLGVELIEDRFETSSNRDQIDRTEDFYLGQRLAARLGYAGSTLGSDRDALMFNVAASRGFGDMGKKALLLRSSVDGRVEHGSLVNALWHVNARYYRQTSEKHLAFMTLSASIGRNLDLDNPLMLGGDNGLRGYPLRYQIGDKRALLTLEYRYFTDWYPFRLVRVGGAVFADAGRTWGDNPAGGGSIGLLKDVGFGLRLVPTRASGREVIHFDIAFPLDGDRSIDSVQILLESKTSF